MAEQRSPYSPSVAVGPLIFVSGQVAVDPATGRFVGGAVAAQTKRALENVRLQLRTHGADMNDVVKTTVFLLQAADFDAMNDVYRQVFSNALPTRSTVAVAELMRPDAVVEIEAIAVRRGKGLGR